MEKKVQKKLALKKETISGLTNNYMNQIVGGTCGTQYCSTVDGCNSVNICPGDGYATAWFRC